MHTIKHKHLRIKVYKLCDNAGHTYDIIVYFRKHSDNATKESRYKGTTVQGLTGSRGDWTYIVYRQHFLPFYLPIKNGSKKNTVQRRKTCHCNTAFLLLTVKPHKVFMTMENVMWDRNLSNFLRIFLKNKHSNSNTSRIIY